MSEKMLEDSNERIKLKLGKYKMRYYMDIEMSDVVREGKNNFWIISMKNEVVFWAQVLQTSCDLQILSK